MLANPSQPASCLFKMFYQRASESVRITKAEQNREVEFFLDYPRERVAFIATGFGQKVSPALWRAKKA